MAIRFNYRRLISEKEFLKVQKRALRLNGSLLTSILFRPGTLIFKTRSGTIANKIWTQTIQIPDVDKLNSMQENKDLIGVIRESGLKVHCDCPAFQFWGYKYMAYKRGYGIQKEFHVPRVRNPNQQGFLCKHLYSALIIYPFIASTVAQRLKVYEKRNTKPPPASPPK